MDKELAKLEQAMGNVRAAPLPLKAFHAECALDAMIHLMRSVVAEIHVLQDQR